MAAADRRDPGPCLPASPLLLEPEDLLGPGRTGLVEDGQAGEASAAWATRGSICPSGSWLGSLGPRGSESWAGCLLVRVGNPDQEHKNNERIYLRAKFGHAQFKYLQAIISEQQKLLSHFQCLEAEKRVFFNVNPHLLKN